MGGRLPSEAEFEYAATNGGETEYPWGNDGAVVANGQNQSPQGPLFHLEVSFTDVQADCLAALVAVALHRGRIILGHGISCRP